MTKLSKLKSVDTDRAKVNAWLDSIAEFDEDCRSEVLAQCKDDAEARMYYVGRYEEIK